jgi:hypothetical protein
MLALKYLLMILGVGLFGSAGALVVYDIYISEQLRRLLARSKTSEAGAPPVAATMITTQRPFAPIRWHLPQHLVIAGVLRSTKSSEADSSVCPTSSASQNPCGWLGTHRWKGGTIMSMQASTAALEPFSQEIVPPPAMRLAPLG